MSISLSKKTSNISLKIIVTLLLPLKGSCCRAMSLRSGRSKSLSISDTSSKGWYPPSNSNKPDGTISVKAGDAIDVMIDRHGPQVEGYQLLSIPRPIACASGTRWSTPCAISLLVSGRVIERTKGGLMVDVGVPAFMPGSQVDIRPIHDLDQFIGQDIPVKVLKINRRRGNVVVSRKMAIEEELKARKSTALDHLFEGAVVAGVVKNLTEYGAFVDLGGIDGLLHVSDMSHGRVNHPSEVVHVGDELTVKVLKFDRDKERISLGLRQLSPDPWETLPDRCPQGSRVIGRVMSITDYGAFVEIEPGVEGLIHISEMTWSRRMKHPSKVVQRRRSGGSRRARSKTAGSKSVAGDQTIGGRSVDHGGRALQHRSAWWKAGCVSWPTSARSSKSKKASTDWCTFRIYRGPST